MLSIDEKTNTIRLTRGDTARIRINLTDANGFLYTPSNGDVIRFAVKKNYYSESPVIHIVIPNDTLILEIQPEDTKSLSFGTYRYDIQITTASGIVDTFIDRGAFILMEEVE